ncbi:uncharacterized protein LOC114362855 [Ostrinia furnacalis]|uniref:uncharacterized protein LOC114362855 n=1 Tax=Ostrinia furnacalis TaxID=93504 RepID=UPI00103F2FA9|nr:uncharacterized protein LOC114362855 [Ostrinia furnacalis]
MENEEDCKCVKIVGHLEEVRWLLWPRDNRASPGALALGDWIKNPFIWLHYVESSDGILPEDQVLMSTDTRYWSIHDVQRYFFGDLHCEQVLFTYQYPNLRMPTRLGSYFWKANTALKLPPKLYQKEFHQSLEITLKKMEAEQCQMDRLMISDQLIKIDQRCSDLVKDFQQRFGKEVEAEEQAEMSPDDAPHENPYKVDRRLLDEIDRKLQQLLLEGKRAKKDAADSIVLSGSDPKRPWRTNSSKEKLLRIENELKRHIEKASDKITPLNDGDMKELVKECQEENLRIRDYDNVRRFLTPSIPLRETHLQLGIDMKMKQRQDSDLSCFIRHVAFRYAHNLVTLSIHQWRFATFPLRRVFELMPRLVRFMYVGAVADEVDLRRMLQIIACGVCDKLKQVSIQIQDDEPKRSYWKQVADILNEEYAEIMQLFEINFCLDIYKL